MRGVRTASLCCAAGPPAGLLVQPAAAGSLLELDRDEVIAAFREHGVLVFQGFPVDAAVFDTFTRRFADRFVIHANATKLRKPPEADVTIGTVDYGGRALGPHSELAFLPRPFRPDILFLHGVRQAPVGGATTVYDGQAIARQLDPATRRILAASRLRYRIPVPRQVWSQVLEIESPQALARVSGDFRIVEGGLRALSIRWLLRSTSWVIGKALRKDLAALDRDDPHFRLAAFLAGPDAQSDSIYVDWETPALTRSRFSGQEALATSLFSGYMRIYGRVNGWRVFRYRSLISRLLETVERYRTPIAWGGGDVLMIDNTRMMHGRERFEDSAGARRHVRTRYGLASWAGGSGDGEEAAAMRRDRGRHPENP
jgi:alpha-ketoglutarate-dependent taurine dioxygenase